MHSISTTKNFPKSAFLILLSRDHVLLHLKMLVFVPKMDNPNYHYLLYYSSCFFKASNSKI